MIDNDNIAITLCPICYPDTATPLTVAEDQSGSGFGFCKIHGEIEISLYYTPNHSIKPMPPTRGEIMIQYILEQINNKLEYLEELNNGSLFNDGQVIGLSQAIHIINNVIDRENGKEKRIVEIKI